MTITHHPSGVLNVKERGDAALNAPKILLVGHNDYDNRHIKRILSPRYNVLIRTSIAAAEELLAVDDFQLIISEYAPTGINGNLLLQRVKALADLPVLVLSFFQGEQEIISLYDHGADEVMRMPFLEYEFVSRVHHLLSK